MASIFFENFEHTTILPSGNLRSDFVEPRNSSKAYAPSAAPSAIAATASILVAGSAKVASGVPDKERAALPAARRRVSCANSFCTAPNPVKTINFVFMPGILMISSALPVAPSSLRCASKVFVSTVKLPDSIFKADSLFGLNESPRTNTPLETTPSVSDSKDMLLLRLKSARRSGYRL